jgi:hypothetical protein
MNGVMWSVVMALQGGVWGIPVVDIGAELAAVTAREPDIGDVQAQALEFSRLSAGRIDGLRASASWKAALPMLEVSGGYSETRLDEDTVLDEYSATDPWVVRGAAGSATEVRVKLSWDLARLAYNGEELDVLALQASQEELLTRVTRLYSKRRRLLVELRGEVSREERLDKQLALDETTAMLSAMTGGWYAAQLGAGAP